MLLLEGLISINLVYGHSKDKCDSYLETALSSINENRIKWVSCESLKNAGFLDTPI